MDEKTPTLTQAILNAFSAGSSILFPIGTVDIETSWSEVKSTVQKIIEVIEEERSTQEARVLSLVTAFALILVAFILKFYHFFLDLVVLFAPPKLTGNTYIPPDHSRYVYTLLSGGRVPHLVIEPVKETYRYDTIRSNLNSALDRRRSP